MPTVSETIEKAIELLGPKMVLRKNVFINAIEDINPHISDEIGVLKKAYSDEIGEILYQTIGERSGDKTVYLKRLTDHLMDECGYNERFTQRFISCFSVYFTDITDLQNNTIPDVSPKSEIDKAGPKKQISYGERLKELREDLNRITDSLGKPLAKEPTAVQPAVQKPVIQKPDDRKQRMMQRYEKAVTLLDEDKTDEAVMLLQSINDGGEYEAKAQHMLGEIFEDDKEEAFMHYSKAAKLGDIEAQFLVGYMSEYGEGTDKDVSKAAEWYKKAADAGHRGAQHNLGYFYYSGALGKQDFKKAFEYFSKAAAQGKTDSMVNIATMYEYGRYVDKDYKKAADWYYKAADNGDPNAMKYYNDLIEKEFLDL